MTALTDVAIQAFGKPNQTALSLLSLLRHCGQYINNIFFIIELAKPQHDTISLSVLTGLHPKIRTMTTPLWIGLDEIDLARLKRDIPYRQSIRYQLAWETCKEDFLLIIHNDVCFHADIVAPMQKAIGDNVAIGDLGQCWMCPASREHIVSELNINGGVVCAHEHYTDFHLTFNDLDAMYRLTKARHEKHRNFLKAPWAPEFHKNPWPLPECRVNEWCCLVDMRMARSRTMPVGTGRPFGAYAFNGDLGVAWFRDMHRQGMAAKHFDLTPYLEHKSGHIRMWNEDAYREAEDWAADILRKEYADMVPNLRARGLKL